jgi:hypothetical protein
MFLLQSALVGGFFFLPGLESFPLVPFSPQKKLIWVLCFIDAWQAFIIMLDQSFFLTDLS